MSNMSDGYLAAMAKSYSNQEGGVTIPVDQLGRIVEIPMGFQPVGVSSRPSPDGVGDDVLIAAYFEPAICRVKVNRDENGLHFAVDWIRGVNHGIQSVRLFPDIYQAGGANRAQCVFYGTDGKTIWVSRNGERDFYILSPPNEASGRWTLAAKLSQPPNGEMTMLHAAVLVGDILVTIESRVDLTDWRLCHYYVSTEDIKAIGSNQPVPDWIYGIGFRGNKMSWTITDFRSSAPHGIYHSDKLIVPEVCGTGIAFLSDGSALVTRYGQSYPGAFNGIPGALIYVPAAMLKL